MALVALEPSVGICAHSKMELPESAAAKAAPTPLRGTGSATGQDCHTASKICPLGSACCVCPPCSPAPPRATAISGNAEHEFHTGSMVCPFGM
jgi:hypothetical protein